jgi:predicted DNA-binding transcriptional regulator YafY
MLDTSARLLKLLSLLQSRRDWTGPALAERLGVTTRTVRNDVERLRNLAYPVDATPGRVRRLPPRRRCRHAAPAPRRRGSRRGRRRAADRDHERLRFDYENHDGGESRRTVEPHRLAHARGRWYLVAFDVDRDEWRMFRVDRMTPRIPTGPRFSQREPPEDVADFVARGLGTATWRFRAKILVHAPADELLKRLPPGVDVVEVTGQTATRGR